MRLFSLLGATLLDGFGGTGDLAMGAVQTWGTSFVDGSADDWVRAETLVFWHCNPASTRIPDAHFAAEARYRGATVVTIAPDYSPSALHASLWVHPRQGSDAALALGIARALLERDAIDAAYVREQTDLPFLVRTDTQRFLRQADLEDGGRDDVFYVWDERDADGIAEAPGTRGRRWIAGARRRSCRRSPGRHRRCDAGGEVAVVPVLELLRERLAAYDPARVEAITGVAPGVQERLAELFAQLGRAR